MRLGICLIAAASLPGCAAWSSSYLVGVRTGNSGEQLEPPQFYRISLRGHAFLQSTRFESGWHDKEAVDQLFSDVVGKVTQVNRELAAGSDAEFMKRLETPTGTSTGTGAEQPPKKDEAAKGAAKDSPTTGQPSTEPAGAKGPDDKSTGPASKDPKAASPSGADGGQGVGTLHMASPRKLSREREGSKSFLVFGPQGQTIDPTDRRLVIFAVTNPRALVNTINQFVDQGTLANAVKSVLLKDFVRDLDDAKSADSSDAKEHEAIRATVEAVKSKVETAMTEAKATKATEAEQSKGELDAKQREALETAIVARRRQEMTNLRDLAQRVLDQFPKQEEKEEKR